MLKHEQRSTEPSGVRRKRRGGSHVRVFLTLAPLAVGLSTLSACDMIQELIGGGGAEVAAEAQAKLEEGDLPGAAADYGALAEEHADNVHVAIGQAYMLLLQGKADEADQVLAAAQEAAGEQAGEIRLRRALVALQASPPDLDAVKTHGTESGLPEGKLLAAEVHLVDLEPDEATALLREVVAGGGVVGETATQYLSMLDSDDQYQAGLAEMTALWALGDREAACKGAEELVKQLRTEDDAKNSALLLWAGRAVSSGLPGVAQSLLDDIDFPPEGQNWRYQATLAMVHIAGGDVEQGANVFRALQAQTEDGSVPLDGLNDALATACGLVEDKDVAKKLVEGVESAAAARCLLEAGAVRKAVGQAPDGPLKTFLENQ